MVAPKGSTNQETDSKSKIPRLHLQPRPCQNFGTSAPTPRNGPSDKDTRAEKCTAGTADNTWNPRRKPARPRVLCSEGRENALRDRRDSLVNQEDRESRRNQTNLGKPPPARRAAKSHLISRSKSTSVKTNPASRWARVHKVRQRAVFFEKCQASAGPDGPRGTKCPRGGRDPGASGR